MGSYLEKFIGKGGWGFKRNYWESHRGTLMSAEGRGGLVGGIHDIKIRVYTVKSDSKS